MEGRKGNKQLRDFARHYDPVITLPQEVYEADWYYKRGDFKGIDRPAFEEDSRPYETPSFVDLRKNWRIQSVVEVIPASPEALDTQTSYFAVNGQLYSVSPPEIRRHNSLRESLPLHPEPGGSPTTTNLTGVRTREAVSTLYVMPESIDQLDPIWGLPLVWVQELGKRINRLTFNMDQVAIVDRRLSIEFITDGLDSLVHRLEPVQAEYGSFPEVTRRIIRICKQIQELITYLQTHQDDITQDDLQLASRHLRITLNEIMKAFTGRAKTTTELLTELRLVAQDLSKVQLSVDRELRQRLRVGLALLDVPATTSESGPSHPSLRPGPAPAPGIPVARTDLAGAPAKAGAGQKAPDPADGSGGGETASSTSAVVLETSALFWAGSRTGVVESHGGLLDEPQQDMLMTGTYDLVTPPVPQLVPEVALYDDDLDDKEGEVVLLIPDFLQDEEREKGNLLTLFEEMTDFHDLLVDAFENNGEGPIYFYRIGQPSVYNFMDQLDIEVTSENAEALHRLAIVAGVIEQYNLRESHEPHQITSWAEKVTGGTGIDPSLLPFIGQPGAAIEAAARARAPAFAR